MGVQIDRKFANAIANALIHLPGRYSASTREWEDFLVRMRTLPQDNVQAQAAFKQAEEVLAKRRRGLA
jgi:hypothetical protein